MRRRTAYALVGAVAGTMLLGTGGTMATFTDSATLTGSVGAGEFALTVTPGTTLRLAPGNGNSSPLTITRTGSGNAQLVLLVGDGARDCSPSQRIEVSATRPGQRSQPSVVSRGLCELGKPDGELPVLDLPDGTNSAQLAIKVTSPGHRWNGTLRFTLRQQGGGFSDTQDVPVRVSPGNR